MHEAILPHELFHEQYKRGGDVWLDGIFGRPSRDNSGICEFWEHERGHEWCQRHPAWGQPDLMSKTVPVGLHGDGVADVKEDKVLVLTWNSVLSRARSWRSRWLFTVLPGRRMAEGTLKEVFRVLVWSLTFALRGHFPHTNHNGEPFPSGSWRERMVGKPLAAGYRLALVEQRGDLEFLAMAYGWHH